MYKTIFNAILMIFFNHLDGGLLEINAISHIYDVIIEFNNIKGHIV